MINKISNRLRRRSKAVQEAIGISGAQGNILSYILAEGEKRSIYQKDIEQEFGLRPSTATEVLKTLEGLDEEGIPPPCAGAGSRPGRGQRPGAHGTYPGAAAL